MSRLALLLGLCFLPIIALAAPPQGKHEYGQGLQGQKCRQLTKDEQERLVVEWGKPSIEDNRYGKRIRIPGQAFLKSAEGKTRELVEGVVIATVIIAQQPDSKPDWSEGYEDNEAYGARVFINMDSDSRFRPGSDRQVLKDRKFVASIPCDRFRRPVGEKKHFQVALSLGRQEGDSARWSNHDHALKQTVAMIEIEGPPKLSPSMQVLCGLPGPLGWGFEPAPLIRAINHFRKAGKEKSIAAFREFLEKAPDAGYGGNRKPDPESIDSANQWCLSILVPFVFEKAPRRFGTEGVVIHEGIPFHTVVIELTTGSPPRMKPLVDWAEKDGEIEFLLLEPTEKPLQAAEDLYFKLFQKMTNEERESERSEPIGRNLKTHLRSQAYSLVRHLVEKPDERGMPLRDITITNNRWSEMKALLDGMKIRWNDEKGKYEQVK